MHFKSCTQLMFSSISFNPFLLWLCDDFSYKCLFAFLLTSLKLPPTTTHKCLLTTYIKGSPF